MGSFWEAYKATPTIFTLEIQEKYLNSAKSFYLSNYGQLAQWFFIANYNVQACLCTEQLIILKLWRLDGTPFYALQLYMINACAIKLDLELLNWIWSLPRQKALSLGLD